MKESRYNVWTDRADASYVFNGVSGAMLRISAEDRRHLRDILSGTDVPADWSPDLLTRLAQGRMIVSDDTDEVTLLAGRYARSRHSTSEFGLTIVTSLGCNFDCPYCFEAKHPSLLDENAQRAVLRILDAQLPTIQTMRVTWFGGEPLVGKDALMALSDQFIERCDAAGVTYAASIVTNGYLLSEAVCRQLGERRVGSAQVCLDGPPDVHDRMRPLANGRGSFWKIVENLHHAVDHLAVTVRMNVDHNNIDSAAELIQILVAEGFAGKIRLVAGHIVGVDDGVAAPSSTYTARCMTSSEFSQAELVFNRLAERHGFGAPNVPNPLGTPCTAVRANELVIGSRGELYKCWESVGNPLEVVGHIDDMEVAGSRLNKWLTYDPFADDECRGCIALPVCMGGCAHHALSDAQYENRCDTFRYTYRERVDDYVSAAAAGNPRLISSAELAHRMDGR